MWQNIHHIQGEIEPMKCREGGIVYWLDIWNKFEELLHFRHLGIYQPSKGQFGSHVAETK